MSKVTARRFATRAAGALVCILVAGGCSTVEHTFVDHEADQVWTAMVAVAEQPRYDDWTIIANDVWVDEPSYRLEIHRQLERMLRDAGMKPFREQRTWQFEVRLLATDPPHATFATRNTAVISQAKAEAERYFDDVLDLLSGLPGEYPLSPQDRDLLDALGLDVDADGESPDG
ncbi:MAG: hypothetical protein ACYSU7_01245 [Planctomycetota bacterium]|jgi:hypothetical protein